MPSRRINFWITRADHSCSFVSIPRNWNSILCRSMEKEHFLFHVDDFTIAFVSRHSSIRLTSVLFRYFSGPNVSSSSFVCLKKLRKFFGALHRKIQWHRTLTRHWIFVPLDFIRTMSFLLLYLPNIEFLKVENLPKDISVSTARARLKA